VHNDSATAANNVEVRFWAMPGGVGLNGNMIGVPQVVSIPPYGTVNVKASADFMSAAPGRHQCAVVSLYNPASGCTIQATTAQQIPDPGVGGYHSCSAWRNTDSMIAIRQGPFGFVLGFGIPEKSGEPIVVKFHPVHVPAGWAQMDKVREINKVLGFVGAKNIYPLYLLPEINKNFAPAAITTKLARREGRKLVACFCRRRRDRRIPRSYRGRSAARQERGHFVNVCSRKLSPGCGPRAEVGRISGSDTYCR
jgi:hypothetical protein